MDLGTDSWTLPTHTAVGGRDLEQEPSLFNAPRPTESGGTILLQVLEFKTRLLEAVEELHIRRDAETRYEDQISKLVLEKQEVEWQKESLQHQIETKANQHTESLTNVKKQFQAKIRAIEEEKGKHQLNTELKDKEINSLKEELKSLQLFKYSLEKKSSELEQKLALQSRSKDSHLNQLGEVEKRFGALSRQCAMVKQAHEKLEQNVNEAMIVNRKLTSVNGKQETTINSLKQVLEELNNKLIKAKVSSVGRCETLDHSAREQHVQQQNQRLLLETEMNKKLRDENAAERAGKQEVMRSLQHTQQLLLSQTQLVSRVGLELETQRVEYQALKREHEAMREKSEAAGGKMARLTEDYTASKINWEKEKTVFLDRIKSEQQDLQAVREAYDQLHQKHTQLSSQAMMQAQHIHGPEIRDCSQSHGVSTLMLPALEEGTRGGGHHNESDPSFEFPGVGSLQGLVPSQTKDPDCLVVTGPVDKLVATGATGGQEASIPSNLFTTPLATNNLYSHYVVSGATGSKADNLSTYIPSPNISESDPVPASDLINTNVAVSDDGLLIGEGSCASATVSVSGPENSSVYGATDLLTEAASDGANRGRSKQDEGGKDEEKKNGEVVYEKDGKEGGSVGEERGQLLAKPADNAERRGDEGETKEAQTAEGWREEPGGRLAVRTPETEIPAQTFTDNDHRDGEKSVTPQAVDSTDNAESPRAASQPSDCWRTFSQRVTEINANARYLKEGHGIGTEGLQTHTNNEVQTLTHRPQEVQPFDCDVVQALTHDVESLKESPATILQVIKASETHAALSAPQSDCNDKIQGLEATGTQLPPRNPPDSTINMKELEERCDKPVVEEGLTVSRIVGPHALLPSQEISEQEVGLQNSLATDSGAFEKRESQSMVHLCENNAGEIAQQPLGETDLKDERLSDYCVDTMVENVGLLGSQALFVSSTLSDKGSVEGPSTNTPAEVETGGHQPHVKNNETEDVTVAQNEALPGSPSGGKEASPETSGSKCHEQPLAAEVLFGEIDYSALPSSKKYRSSFEWAGAQRKKGSPKPEPNTSRSGGFPGRSSPSTISTVLKGKQHKDPLVITRASNLLNSSNIPGPPASSKRDQQGEWKAIRESFRETATGDTKTRDTPSLGVPVSSSSSTVSRLSWPSAPGSSRTPDPDPCPDPSSGSDGFPSASQLSENQQCSFRDQISKIEQFLYAERLRLPKRRRTDE